MRLIGAWRHVLGALGAISLGAASGATVIAATTTGTQSVQPSGAEELRLQAELACEEALEKNTIEALEEFLRKYPEADTACRALALNALQSFAPTASSDTPRRGDGGYAD